MLLKTTMQILQSSCTVTKKPLFKRLRDLFCTLYLAMQNKKKIGLKILRYNTLNFALMVNLPKWCREKTSQLF